MSDEDPDGDGFACVLRTTWPSTIAMAEEILDAAGISHELVEMFDGEEWELRVPRFAEAAALELLAELREGA